MPGDSGQQFENLVQARVQAEVKNFQKSIAPHEPKPSDVPHPGFRFEPGVKVFVKRTSGAIEDNWTFSSEGPDGMSVKAVDEKGRTLLKTISKQKLEDLNRPTVLADIRGMGAEGIDDLVHVVKRLQEGGITDGNGFASSDKEIQLIMAAYNGDITLDKLTTAGYLKQVVEHHIKLRKLREELDQMVKSGQKVPETEVKTPSEAVQQARVLEPGAWVNVLRDGKMEGNWIMMQPDPKSETVHLIQIVDNLPWREKTVPFAELRRWNP